MSKKESGFPGMRRLRRLELLSVKWMSRECQSSMLMGMYRGRARLKAKSCVSGNCFGLLRRKGDRLQGLYSNVIDESGEMGKII
jgi:hypothetical protein